MHRPIALVLAAAAALALTSCATPSASGPAARVVVSVAPEAHPEAYEIRLATAERGFRSVHRLRSGQTTAFTVPAGWVTVRVPGVCVVPTPAAGTTRIRIAPDDCRVTSADAR